MGLIQGPVAIFHLLCMPIVFFFKKKEKEMPIYDIDDVVKLNSMVTLCVSNLIQGLKKREKIIL